MYQERSTPTLPLPREFDSSSAQHVHTRAKSLVSGQMLNEFRGKWEKATQAISINTMSFFLFILFMACFWLLSQKLYQCDPVVSVKSMIYGHQKNSSDRKSSLRCMRWSKIARELEGRARGNTREARKSERASRVFLPRVRCSNSRSIAVGFPAPALFVCQYSALTHTAFNAVWNHRPTI